MAHTIMKQIYDSEKKKFVVCEVLVLDKSEKLPGTDRREIILACVDSVINDSYPETELIDQYEDFDNRS